MISFDNIEFDTPVIFTDSNINNPDSYYVKKINTYRTYDSAPYGINYLRFMSDCVGLAL